MPRPSAFIACAVFSLAFAGCGSGPSVVPVSGTVVRKGQPVANLFLNFMPLAIGKNGRPSWGQTDDQGQFKLHYDPEREGAEIGKHRVFVRFRASNPKEELEMISGKRKIHADRAAIEEKYGKMETSPLEIEVTAGGAPVRIELD